MKAGNILIAGGITVGSLVIAGSSLAAAKKPDGSEPAQVCTEEEQEAFHQYLLEQGLLDMEGILGDGCSEFNSTMTLRVRVEPDNPSTPQPDL